MWTPTPAAERAAVAGFGFQSFTPHFHVHEIAAGKCGAIRLFALQLIEVDTSTA